VAAKRKVQIREGTMDSEISKIEKTKRNVGFASMPSLRFKKMSVEGYEG